MRTVTSTVCFNAVFREVSEGGDLPAFWLPPGWEERKSMKNYISHSPEQTEQIAAEFASTLKSGDVIAYKGPMGTG